MTKKTQKSGDNSTNIQADSITVLQQGLSYDDVRSVALDVFKENFIKISGNANNVAENRCFQITDFFLTKLQNENPRGFKNAEDPDFQYSLFMVQKEYARNGDKELGDLLVNLLVDRSKQEQRDILQIVLNESLIIAPKLTRAQLAILAIVFVFKHTNKTGDFKGVDDLWEYFDLHIKPFVKDLVKNIVSFQHLQFSGCGSISEGIFNRLEDILGRTYQGLFLKGFDPEELEKRDVQLEEELRMTCFNDDKKIQIRALNIDDLSLKMKQLKIPDEKKTKIIELFNLNKMNKNEIKEKCIEGRSYMNDVFDIWSNSKMQMFNLTSVGIAIGHANVKRLVGEFANLSIWIN